MTGTSQVLDMIHFNHFQPEDLLNNNSSAVAQKTNNISISRSNKLMLYNNTEISLTDGVRNAKVLQNQRGAKYPKYNKKKES